MARSSAQVLEGIVKTLSEEGGSFGLTYRFGVKPGDGPWMAALEWGQEAPDSPMAGAAAYGIGESASEACDQMLDEAGVKP
jgi:hypothetical protein